MTSHEIELTGLTGSIVKRKSSMVSVRLSDEDLKIVQERAEAEGISVSAYLRNVAMNGSTISVLPPVPQIVRAAHASSRPAPRRPLMSMFTNTAVVTGS